MSPWIECYATEENDHRTIYYNTETTESSLHIPEEGVRARIVDNLPMVRFAIDSCQIRVHGCSLNMRVAAMMVFVLLVYTVVSSQSRLGRTTDALQDSREPSTECTQLEGSPHNNSPLTLELMDGTNTDPLEQHTPIVAARPFWRGKSWWLLTAL
eukprot:SAG31_NODE_25365_length_462_cov_1.426997_1_plen_154_part_11